MQASSRRLDLSVCSILKNEAANLPGLTACIPISRVEWIVLDTGSTDVTPELLRKAGVEPRNVAWCEDFSPARNATLQMPSRSWILCLDGDDRLAEGFWEAL